VSYVHDILDEHQQLATARLPWETHWRDIARYVLPQTEGFDTLVSTYPLAAVDSVVSTPVAAKQSAELYDMTSLWAIERLAAGLLSLKTPETEQWHNNQLDDPFGADPTHDEEVALERLRDYQFRVRANPKSGFWPAHRSALKSMCGFGDGWMFVEEVMGRGPGMPYRFSYIPIIECYPGMDPNGMPNRMFRPYLFSCEQVVRKFGADKVSKTVRDKANDPKTKHNRVQVLHAVRPRDQSDQYSKLGNMGAAFASCYILPDDKHLIGESGFYEFPFVRYAWSNTGVTPYSTGPVAYAIGELKSLQEMAKQELIAVSSSFRPPVATVGKNFARLNWNPGATNAGLVSPDGKPLFATMGTGARPDFAQAVMEARRNNVREMLYLNLWQIIIDAKQGSGPDTATAALIRAQEKGEMFGPVGISLNEGLSMMTDREVAILGRKGAFRQGSPLAMPQSMGDKNIAPAFSSPLDRLRRMGELIGMQRLIEFALLLTGNDPERAATVLSRFDIDDMLERAQDILGAPATNLRDREAADGERQSNAQMQQLLGALQSVQMGGEAARAVGEGGAALAGGAEAVNQSPALRRGIGNMPAAIPAAQQAGNAINSMVGAQ
jgi:hypothetical protein